MSKCFVLIHCDIGADYHVKSFCGASYFLTILDNAGRGVWTYLMHDKSEASQLVRNFCVMVTIQFWARVKSLEVLMGANLLLGL